MANSNKLTYKEMQDYYNKILRKSMLDLSTNYFKNFDSLKNSNSIKELGNKSISDYYNDNLKKLTVNPSSISSSTKTNKLDAGKNGEGIPLGDKIGIYGDLFSSLMNLGVTLSSKNNSQNMNPFANYAKRALDKYQEINTNIDANRTLEEQNKILAENTQREKNRLSSRGINTNRALDLSTYIAGLGAERKIDTNYFNRVSNVQQQEAKVMLNQDATIMAAEERKQNREQANADNFLSNLSSNITDIGTTGESIGKTVNTEEENKIKAATALKGQNGTPEDYLKYLGLDGLFNKLGLTVIKK